MSHERFAVSLIKLLAGFLAFFLIPPVAAQIRDGGVVYPPDGEPVWCGRKSGFQIANPQKVGQLTNAKMAAKLASVETH